MILICIIGLFVYVIYRLADKKRYNRPFADEGFDSKVLEGATTNSETVANATATGKNTGRNAEGVRGNSVERSSNEFEPKYPPASAFMDDKNLPLKEYAIYASFNSAYDGNTNTLEQLGTVMYQGCRFIDLNVFQVNEDYYVGYAKDNAPISIETSLKLSKVVDYINSYAFTVDTKIGDKVKNNDLIKQANNVTTNAGDKETIQKNYVNYPLFLNIRVYRPQGAKSDISTAVLQMLTKPNAGLNNLHKTGEGDEAKAISVNQFTRLADLSKKVILSMDYQNILQLYASVGDNIYDAKNIPVETLAQINKSVNLQIGTDTWQAFYKYADVDKNRYDMLQHKNASLESKHSYETNTDVMKLAYPFFDEPANPDSYTYIQKYKIQTVPNRFYIDDNNLTKYNTLFYKNNTPFVPLYHAYTFIQTGRENAYVR